MMPAADVAAFEEARSALRALAYRILGSYAEAEDAVQDTFVKWQAADRERIETPRDLARTVAMHDVGEEVGSGSQAEARRHAGAPQLQPHGSKTKKENEP